MDDHVELPVRRRGARIAVPSGLVLFVCLFLPAMQQCGEVAYPYQVPLACAPYLLGLGVAIAAMRARPITAASVDTARALAGLSLALWLGCTLWFGLLNLDDGAMIGVALSAWASAWLVVASILRVRDLRAASRVVLPRAQVGAVRVRRHLSPGRLVVSMVVTFALAAAARPWAARPPPDVDWSGLFGGC